MLTRTSTGYAWANPTGSGGGEENVQSDWSVTDANSDAYIRNKPNVDVVAETANPIVRETGAYGTRLKLATDGVPTATPKLTDTLLLWDAVGERWVQATASDLRALFEPTPISGTRYLFVQPYPGGATSYAAPVSITADDITADGTSNSSTTHELVFPTAYRKIVF